MQGCELGNNRLPSSQQHVSSPTGLKRRGQGRRLDLPFALPATSFIPSSLPVPVYLERCPGCTHGSCPKCMSASANVAPGLASNTPLLACMGHLILAMASRCSCVWPYTKNYLNNFCVRLPIPPTIHILPVDAMLLEGRVHTSCCSLD